MATLELDGLATSLLAYRVESEYIASESCRIPNGVLA